MGHSVSSCGYFANVVLAIIPSWRSGGLEGWRLESWRAGGMEGWSEPLTISMSYLTTNEAAAYQIIGGFLVDSLQTKTLDTKKPLGNNYTKSSIMVILVQNP